MTPVGSAGDVNPFVALGKELARRGHDVVVITSEPFRETVVAAGLEFESVLPSERFERALGDPDLWHPIRGIRALFRLVDRASMERLWRVLDERWVDGRSVLVGHTLSFPTRIYEERHGVPAVTLQLAPIAFRTLERQPVLPPGIDIQRLPRPLLRAFWWSVDRIGVDPLARPALHDFFRSRGLEPERRLFRDWVHSPRRVLGLFPEWFGPPQPDWPPQLRLVGFPLFDGFEQPELDPALASWLGEGPAPIVFAPGSANRQAPRFFQVGATASAEVQRRAVFVTPWADQLPHPLPDHVYHVARAPFSALFTRSGAVVHHGGIGTTAQALRAGVPQVVLGGAFDQPDNGARVERLGVGRRIRPGRLSRASLSRALSELMDDATVAARAADFARRLEADGDGALRRAADEVEAVAAV